MRGIGTWGGCEPGLGDAVGKPGPGEVVRGVPLLADTRTHRGVGEVDHDVADAGGDLLLGVPEGVGVTSVGTEPATRMTTSAPARLAITASMTGPSIKTPLVNSPTRIPCSSR